ncbi:hypothetical protein AAC387_Pa03g1872 [Persea americana]
MKDHANKESSSGQEDETGTISVVGVLGSELSSQSACVEPAEGNPSSSSWSHLKSYFVGMGFSPTLVEKVIEEKGEDDSNLLLETLFTYSEALQKSNSEYLDLPDGISRKDENTLPAKFIAYENGQEIEVITSETLPELMDKTLLQLREMGFSEPEISFAVEKLGAEVPILELADSIFANRFANTSIHEDKTLEDDALELKMRMLQSASVIALL